MNEAERKLQISYVNPKDIKPNPWNSNELSAQAEAQLEASIKRLKVFKPILCRELPNGTLQVLGGHHRVDAIRRAGHKEVPIINLGDIDEKRAREISLADNGRYGRDDPMRLLEIVQFLNSDGDVDLGEFLPYDEFTLDAALASKRIDLSALGDINEFEDPSADFTPDEDVAKSIPTHQTLRFSVALDDAVEINKLIQRTIDKFAFKGNALNNAGDALAKLLLDQRRRSK